MRTLKIPKKFPEKLGKCCLFVFFFRYPNDKDEKQSLNTQADFTLYFFQHHRSIYLMHVYLSLISFFFFFQYIYMSTTLQLILKIAFDKDDVKRDVSF